MVQTSYAETSEHSHEGISEFNQMIWSREADARSAVASLRGATKNNERIYKSRIILSTIEYLSDKVKHYRLLYSNTLIKYMRSEAELACLREEVGKHDIKSVAESFSVYERLPSGEVVKTTRVYMFPSGRMIDGNPCVCFKSAASLVFHLRRFDCEIKMIDGIQSIIYPTNAFYSNEEGDQPTAPLSSD